MSRIANLMLSATAPPCAYSPSSTAPLPYFRHSDRKRGINSIEVELDESNRKKREKIMRMMEKGSSNRAKESIVGSSTHAPSFARMSFVERWRSAKAANEATTVNLSDGGMGDGTGTANADEQKSGKKKSKKKKAGEEEVQEVREGTPPPGKKKSKKRAQREKEEREKAEREQAQRDAAAAKAKEEEGTKKGKKNKKKERELAAQQQAQAEAEAAEVAAAAAAETKKAAKKASKTKKAKIQPSPATTNASISSDAQQQKNGLGTSQQGPHGLGMYPQQMGGYPMMNQPGLGQSNSGGGLHASFPNQFPNNGGGLNLPGGQTNNYSSGQQQQQQQQLQQAAIQRALQQSGMNGNFMMNANHSNQMQQHMQALAAMQQHNLGNDSTQSATQTQDAQRQAQFGQDSLPVGVGLGNLPAGWSGMG